MYIKTNPLKTEDKTVGLQLMLWSAVRDDVCPFELTPANSQTTGILLWINSFQIVRDSPAITEEVDFAIPFRALTGRCVADPQFVSIQSLFFSLCASDELIVYLVFEFAPIIGRIREHTMKKKITLYSRDMDS